MHILHYVFCIFLYITITFHINVQAPRGERELSTYIIKCISRFTLCYIYVFIFLKLLYSSKLKLDRRSCTESRHRINLFPSYPTYTHILQIELVCLNTISIHLQNLWQIEFFSIPCIRWFSKKNFILRTLQHMLWGTFLTNMCMPNFFPIPFTFGVRT